MKCRTFIVAALAASCAGRPVEESQVRGKLVADGSSSLHPLVLAAAGEFGRQHPGVEFDIKNGGSGVGIKRLTQGDAQQRIDFAKSSRPIKPAEVELGEKNGHHVHATVVAAEAIAVVVHPDNSLVNITVDALKAIYYSGETVDWSTIPGSGRRGPIKVVALDPKVSGTGEMFTELVGGHSKPPFAKIVQIVPDNPDMAAPILANVDAIGFCSQAAVAGSKLRILTVNGVRPSEQTVLDTSYRLNRRLYVLTDGQPRGLMADFLLFMLSEPGQRLARQRGFTPVTLEVAL